MPYSFTDWKEFHSKRGLAKRRDYRVLRRDVRVRATDEQVTFHYVAQWSNDKQEEELLATITHDNVLTFHIDFSKRKYTFDTMTVCNRIYTLCGIACGSNKSRHRNKESSIRLYTHKWSRRMTGENSSTGHPTYEYYKEPAFYWTNRVELPYNAGLSFQLNNAREITKLLHAEPDRRVQIKPDMKRQTKADTAVLRKLVLAMSRMGAFNDRMSERMSKPYNYQPVGKIEEVTYHEPTGRDAEIVFTHGMAVAYMPPKHRYDKGTYIELTDDERLLALRTRAVENGMKILRKHIYETQDGYEKVEV